MCWKLEQRNGKATKPPYQVGGRLHAKSTDPRTWSTFDACFRSAFVDGAATGIGIVLDGSDDLLAADLDHCIHESGAVMPWAGVVVRMLASYTERSPSGTSLRVFFRGAMWTRGCSQGEESGVVGRAASGQIESDGARHLGGTDGGDDTASALLRVRKDGVNL